MTTQNTTTHTIKGSVIRFFLVLMMAQCIQFAPAIPPNSVYNYSDKKEHRAIVKANTQTEHRTEAQTATHQSQSGDTKEGDSDGDADNDNSDHKRDQTRQQGQKIVGKRERLLNLLTRIEALEAKINEMEAT